jgi:N-acetylmuramoyl-L-alanine amidase
MSTQYKIKDQTDCASSIAYDHGFAVETIWRLEENRALCMKRPDKNTLAVGDVIVIPDKRLKSVSCQTEQLHKFRLKDTLIEFRLKLLEQNVPLSDLPYRLVLDDAAEYIGTLDNGELRVKVCPTATHATLRVGEGDEARVYELELGGLDPCDTVSGIQARLENLGYDPGPIDNIMGPLTSAAISAFQEDENDLNVNGKEDDEDTIKRLNDVASCQ